MDVSHRRLLHLQPGGEFGRERGAGHGGRQEGRPCAGTSQSIRGSCSAPPLAGEPRGTAPSVPNHRVPAASLGPGQQQSQDRGTGNGGAVGARGEQGNCKRELPPLCGRRSISRPALTPSPPPQPNPHTWLTLGPCPTRPGKGGGACTPEQHVCLCSETPPLLRRLQGPLRSRVYTATCRVPDLA